MNEDVTTDSKSSVIKTVKCAAILGLLIVLCVCSKWVITGPKINIRNDFDSYRFGSLQLGVNNTIPTLTFMQTCIDQKQLLGVIGTSANLIESDLQGNGAKLKKVYEENPEVCQTLQSMLLFDIKMGKVALDDRSVNALTWLKRAYVFIEQFFRGIADGQQPQESAGRAYDNTLSKHHAWYVRSLFKVSMNLLPTRHNFLARLAINEEDLNKPNYEEKSVADMRRYVDGMQRLFAIISDFFTENGLPN